MQLKHDTIDYDALIGIHEELAVIVAMTAEQSYEKLPITTYDLIEYGIRLQWAFLENSTTRKDYLRKLAATCLWLLIEQGD